MDIQRLLIYDFAPALAKVLATLCFGGNPAAMSGASSLVDIVQSHLEGAREQRRTERLIAEISEKIVEGLKSLFEVEGVPLSEASVRAAVETATAVFESVQLDARFIVRRNLDPQVLYEHLRTASEEHLGHFSNPELQLYERLLDETCTRLVDIAAQLPTFTEQAIGEVLRRESELLEVVSDVMREVELIRRDIRGSQSAESALFEEKYRLAVSRALDTLSLFGVDLPSARNRYSLSVAYITLRASVSSDPSNGFGSNVLPVPETVCGCRHLLICGDAGSGKTTLLQWLAVQAAQGRFDGRMGELNASTPFFIRLRDFVDQDLPAPERFPAGVAPSLLGMMPDGWVHEQLASGCGLVLVDGIDEVSAEKRASVVDWLEELVLTFPDSRFVVTSRPYAVDEGALVPLGFERADLTPMDLADVERFIDHWHQAAATPFGRTEMDEDIQRECEHLVSIVRREKPLRTIAANPMLCAMICALHRDRRGRLPSRRLELYESCIYMLAERRDAERGVTPDSHPELAYEQKRFLIDNLAYWFQRNGVVAVPRGEVEDYFTTKLTGMLGLPPGATGRAATRFFLERTGLIREVVPGRIDFAHRTFQEFLAAQAAINEGDVGLLIDKGHDDQWHETIVLACGLARGPRAEQVVEGLLKRGDKSRRFRPQLHLLALACLETAVQLSDALRERIARRTSKLVPPRDSAELKALVHAGDLAVGALAFAEARSSHDNCSCIRALGLIGTEAALGALEGYAELSNTAVIAQILQALGRFPEDFPPAPIGRLVQRLSLADENLVHASTWLGVHAPAVKQIHVAGCRDNDCMRALAEYELEEVRCTSCRSLVDLIPLAGLRADSLNVESCPGFRSLSGAESVSRLKSLRVSDCEQFSDLNGLAKLPSLERLRIEACPPFNLSTVADGIQHLSLVQLKLDRDWSLDFLKRMPNLRQLDLVSIGKGSEGPSKRSLSFDALSAARSLTELTIDAIPDLRDSVFSRIASIPNLQILRLRNVPARRGLKELAGLPSLRQISLYRCDVSRSFLKDEERLRSLIVKEKE